MALPRNGWILGLIWALTLAFGLWAWTIYSVYFAGGQTRFTRPDSTDGVQLVPVAEGFYAISGAGGNITISTGDEGILMVDTGYSEMVPAVIEAISKIATGPVVRIINTHFHHDHAEGNDALGSGGAVMLAHSNSLESMQSLLGDPFTQDHLPDVTFEDRHAFSFNGQEIELIHVPGAHTNGDIFVVFRPANIIAAGDALSTDALPYLSLGTGASLDGHLAAQEVILALADENTHIIPGHGPMADRQTLETINSDLRRIRERLARLKEWGVPRRLRVLFHPLAGWPKSRQRDGDWEKYWTSLAWDSLP